MRRPAFMLALAFLTACQETVTRVPVYVPGPLPPPTDMSPVGGGLSVIGLGLVIGAVVIVLGEVLRGPKKGGDRDE